MTDSSNPEERPHKRLRVDQLSSETAHTEALQAPQAPQAPSTAPKEPAAQDATATAPSTTASTDQEREVRAGITEYVSPNRLSFSGVLKQRYTDFLVNEIGLDGKVVRLRSVGIENKRERNDVVGKEGESVAKDGENREAVVKHKQEIQIEEDANGADAEQEKGKEDEEGSKISEEDLVMLHSIFGEDTTNQVLKLVRSIRKHPNWKAKEFKAIISPPVLEKDTRTKAHQSLRRIFPNLLESAMEQDQSIRIKASPPVNRNNKRKRGGDREWRPDSRRGQLGWEELGGEFLHFTLYKENKDTMEVVGFMGSTTGGGSKSFSFAGTKDKRACTVQRVCVKRQTAERMVGIGRKLYSAAIGDFEYKSHDLRLGDLAGNEFVITLRSCHFEKEDGLKHEERLQLAKDVVSDAVREFSENGFINYYGLQRFGSFAASTDMVGIKLLQENFKGAVEDLLAYNDVALAAYESTEDNPTILVSQDDRARAKALHIWKTEQRSGDALSILPKKFAAERNIIQHLGSKNGTTKRYDRLNDYQGALMTIPRNLRLMYVHAYQSLVWNTVAGKRWSLFGSKVVEGDLVLVSEHPDKEETKAEEAPADTVDQDGEVIINPAGADSAIRDSETFDRARPLSKEEAESGNYTIFDIVLPQPGFDVEYPPNAIGTFYEDFMGSEQGGGLDPHKMRRRWRDSSLSGAYRKFLARPLQPVSFDVRDYTRDEEQFVQTDLQRLTPQAGGLGSSTKDEGKEEEGEEQAGDKKIAVVLTMQLASSQYATIALRELLKAGGLKAFQPLFMGGR